jgi:hypothetical protein
MSFKSPRGYIVNSSDITHTRLVNLAPVSVGTTLGCLLGVSDYLNLYVMEVLSPTPCFSPWKSGSSMYVRFIFYFALAKGSSFQCAVFNLKVESREESIHWELEGKI